jgi:hypothetical protein
VAPGDAADGEEADGVGGHSYAEQPAERRSRVVRK